jgi:hypothetical protein
MKKKTLRLTTLYLSHRQFEEFNKEAQEKSITFAELIRRTLDNYLDNKKK